ncbi:Fur family transcriptional regulator [Sulfoacidibacillus thermotolerans]|uniref:Transcriptional repressor n=1 Tax=Sulfoacidibacillus thermotolerans TaxID=1765684 RepID=A0A2U3D985_SULT2|nr:Fur family transcriptional regulator [Sulfoacidibacillus thermotolerans]PWI57825.1 hypothetical protein BM613_06445 [Sulfoacidibacillus thermotolerans]
MDHWDAMEVLKDVNLRATPQRIAVLNVLKMLGQAHPTAEEIYVALKQEFPAISFATVYNTLKSFLDAGLLHELRFGDKASRYDLNTQAHHHLLCEVCGDLIDIYLPEVDVAQVLREHEFAMSGYHVEIRGVCKTCREHTLHKADTHL